MEEERTQEEDAIINISSDLIMSVSDTSNFSEINVLNLQLKSFKISIIENLQDCTNLIALNLSNNIIKKIENLGMLQSLKELNLAENKIRNLENLQQLTGLTTLNLYGNQIKDIPKMSLECLRSLKKFNIGCNRVCAASELGNIAVLKSLHRLNIAGNSAAEQSQCRDILIYRLPRLKSIDDEQINDITRDRVSKRFDIGMIRSPQGKEIKQFESDTKEVLKKYKNKKRHLKQEIAQNEVDIDNIKTAMEHVQELIYICKSKHARVKGKVEAKKLQSFKDKEDIALEKDLLQAMKTTKSEMESQVMSLTEELEFLKERTRNGDQACEDLYLNRSVETSREEQKVRTRLAEVEEDVENSIGILQEAKDSMVDLQGKILAREEELSRLKQRSEECEEQEEYVLQLQIQTDAVDQDIEHRTGQLTELNDTIGSTESEFQELEKKYKSIQSTNKTSNYSIPQLERQIQSATDTLDSLKNELYEYEVKLEEVEIASDHIREIDDESIQVKEALQCITKLIRIRKEGISSAHNEITKRKQAIRGFSHRRNENQKRYTSELSTQNQKLAELTQEISYKNQELIRVNAALKKETSNNQQVDMELQKNNQEQEQLEAAVDNRSCSIDIKQSQLSSLEGEIAVKQADLISLKQTIDDFDDNLDGKREILSKVIAYLTDLESATGQKTDTLESLYNQIQLRQESIEWAQRELQEKKNEVTMYEQQFSESGKHFQVDTELLEEQISMVEGEIDGYKNTLSQLEHQLGLKRDTYNNINRNLTEANEKVNELTSVHDKLDQQVKEQEDVEITGTEEIQAGNQRLSELKATISNFDEELVSQKQSLAEIIEDCSDVEQTVLGRVAELDKVKRLLQHKNDLVELQNIEFSERSKQLNTIKQQISEGKKNYINQKKVQRGQMRVLNAEIAEQQENNKRIREILINVKNQKAHIAQEITTLETQMHRKEEDSDKELNVLAESISHGQNMVAGLKEAVQKEVSRQKSFAQDEQDLRDRTDELKTILDGLERSNVTNRKQLRIAEEVEYALRPDEDSALVLLALGGNKIDARIQGKIDNITSARSELPNIEHDLAMAAEELKQLQFEQSVTVHNSEKKPYFERSAYSSVLPTDRQTVDYNRLEQLHKENMELKQIIRQREEFNQNYIKKAEEQLTEKHSMLDDKMVELMSSLNNFDTILVSQENPMSQRSSNNDLCRLIPEKDELQQIWADLDEGMERLRSVTDLPVAMPETPEQGDAFSFEEDNTLIISDTI